MDAVYTILVVSKEALFCVFLIVSIICIARTFLKKD
jgi:hypothetical protein